MRLCGVFLEAGGTETRGLGERCGLEKGLRMACDGFNLVTITKKIWTDKGSPRSQ